MHSLFRVKRKFGLQKTFYFHWLAWTQPAPHFIFLLDLIPTISGIINKAFLIPRSPREWRLRGDASIRSERHSRVSGFRDSARISFRPLFRSDTPMFDKEHLGSSSLIKSTKIARLSLVRLLYLQLPNHSIVNA